MKKRILFTAVLAAVCAVVFTLCAGAATLGDINGDGQRDPSDARLALRASVRLENYAPGSPEFVAADANGNGEIEPSDARTILRASVKLDPLPDDPAEVIVSEGYADPLKGWETYDELIRQIKSETNSEKRAALMHEAEDMLMETYCVLPLYYYNDAYLQKSYVDGVYATPYATKYFQYATKTDGDKTLRLCLASEPDTLDPAFTTSVDGACLAACAYEGLYTYEVNGQTAPACADSYTVTPDGMTYTVKLKEGLKWSDGSPLTAADFVSSWKRAAAGSDYGYMFSGFDGYENGDVNVTAVDDTTLRFVLIAPCLYMEDLMAFPTFFPVKQDAEGFVSNGAFVCTNWKHDESITYTKNPYFYNADSVKLNTLDFLLSYDEDAIYAAYQKGELDLIDTIPMDVFAALAEKGDGELHLMNMLGTYYIAFNAKSGIFDGKTSAQAACMREAVSLLIDRDAICKNIGKNGQPAAETFIPVGMADGNGGLFHNGSDRYYDAYAINHNADKTLDRARQLLSAAGYLFDENGKLSAETPLTIEYLTNAGGAHVAIAEMIQTDLARLGIGLTIRTADWNDFMELRKDGEFTLAREGWIADFNDPINMLELFTSDSGNNDCQFGK